MNQTDPASTSTNNPPPTNSQTPSTPGLQPVSGEIIQARDTEWPWPHYPRKAERNYTRYSGERFTGWEGDWLYAYVNSGIKLTACQSARVSMYIVDSRIKADPDFARAVAEAREMATQAIEAAALNRAVNGVVRRKPIVYKGEVKGYEEITEYSDTLMIFLLKGLRPEVYRERMELQLSVAQVKQEIARIAQDEGLDEAAIMEEYLRIKGQK